jgi:holo-[acyl-carrier protein] synthase
MRETPPRRPASAKAPTPRRHDPPRLAVGVDLVERQRVIATHARFGDRFLRKVFTERERAQAGGRIERLVGRFAAKEACAKTLGTGIGKDAAWHEIEILRQPSGNPMLVLSGRAAERARALGLAVFDVSISDTHEHTMAVVVAVGV